MVCPIRQKENHCGWAWGTQTGGGTEAETVTNSLKSGSSSSQVCGWTTFPAYLEMGCGHESSSQNNVNRSDIQFCLLKTTHMYSSLLISPSSKLEWKWPQG